METTFFLFMLMNLCIVNATAMMIEKRITEEQKNQIITKLCNTEQAREELAKINQWPPKIDELTGDNFRTVLNKVQWYYFLHTKTEKHETKNCYCTELRTKIDKQLYILFVMYTSEKKSVDPAIEQFLKWAENNSWYDNSKIESK